MIDLALFDYMDDVVGELNSTDRDDYASISEDSTAVIFLESFFDQFFAQNGHAIVGTSLRAKRKAGAFAEKLGNEESTAFVRKLVVAFEELCDVMKDIQGNYGGETTATPERLYPILERVLGLAVEWLGSIDQSELSARASQALQNFQVAL